MTDDRERMGRDDETLQRDERDLTPPHGDELRSEETFGRTDRYTNIDDELAERTEETEETEDTHHGETE